MLIYVAAAIAAGVFLSLLLARYFFIKRHYPPTFRAYFIPLKGIHIPFLHLHIDGPPPRPNNRRDGPPSYGVSIMQRRRRDRTTRGEGIGEGGRRRGERDGDDGFDGEGEHVGGEGASGGVGQDELPMYVLETGLPGYHTVDGEAGTRDGNQLPPPPAALPSSTTTTTTSPALPSYPPPTAISSLPSHNQEEGDITLPSVQAYELATRRARDALSPRYGKTHFDASFHFGNG
uniref:Uncharacterized protein n=1 Tax=Leucosporidium scottii TaxID=5278 RepID=A0A0H5FT92_9BASI|nr:hypothetical protein [Leucosporidium scottii]